MVKALMALLAAASLSLSSVPAAAQTGAQAKAEPQITFHKDIEPILQRSCQRCHNPDSVAPMSLITYAQVRPYARGMKQRTELRYAAYSRGAMPPWFLETSLGIQKMKDDYSLTNDEIAKIGKWADAGAPEGDPADAPVPLKLAGAGEWKLGKPDLIVSSPTVYVMAVASDWGGPVGRSPIPLTEDRYARSAEYMEVNTPLKGNGATIGSRFVFHHMTASLVPPDLVADDDSDGETPSTVGTSLPIHEVGRNGDVFPEDAGKLMPANGFVSWGNMHVHASGVPGSERYARIDLGFRLHPSGYKPTHDIRAYGFGRTQIEVEPNQANQREDAYFVAPQAMKLINYEPHMHANGVRMCLQAIYGRAVETLNCTGYDHNWVRDYYYEENFQPLIPKGTVLHAVGWFDNSAKNANVIDPRNVATFGNSSVSNMFIVFNQAEFLTDEQYRDQVAQRKEFLAQHPDVENIGCLACYLPLPPKQDVAATAPAATPAPTATPARPAASKTN